MTKVDRADAKDTGSWVRCDKFDGMAWRPSAHAAANRSIPSQRVRNATSLDHSRIISLLGFVLGWWQAAKRFDCRSKDTQMMRTELVDGEAIARKRRYLRRNTLSFPRIVSTSRLPPHAPACLLTGAKTWMKKAKTHEVWTNLFHMTSC